MNITSLHVTKAKSLLKKQNNNNIMKICNELKRQCELQNVIFKI